MNNFKQLYVKQRHSPANCVCCGSAYGETAVLESGRANFSRCAPCAWRRTVRHASDRGVYGCAPCVWRNSQRALTVRRRRVMCSMRMEKRQLGWKRTRSRHASLHTYGRTAAIATCSPHMDFLHAHGATRRSDWLKILLLRLLMGYSRALRIKTEAVA